MQGAVLTRGAVPRSLLRPQFAARAARPWSSTIRAGAFRDRPSIPLPEAGEFSGAVAQSSRECGV